MRFTERYKILPLTESADVTTAGVDSQSVNMGLVHSACFLLNFGAVTANDTLKVYVGAAAAAKTTAIAFAYRLAGADTKSAGSDALGAVTDVAATGLTLTAATFDHRMVAIEIDSQAIPDDTPYVTIEIAGDATAQNVSIVAIADPRHAANDGLPTVL